MKMKMKKQQPAEDEILQRHLRWIGHTLRNPMTCITRQALTWSPQGKRKRGRPRQLERLAQGRDAWTALVGGLCSSRGLRQLTVLRRSAHRDAHASRPYSKTNIARCALWCLRDDIFEQYLEQQLTFRTRQMADLYSREQCFSSVKIYNDVPVFDIEALCFGSQLKKRRTTSRVPFIHEGDFGCVVA